MIKFKKEDVLKLLDILEPEDPVVLVGDHGIYLMSFAEKSKEKLSRTVAYAEGTDPDKDEDFYDNKVGLYGGDDGCDPVGSAKEIRKILECCKDYFVILITMTDIRLLSDS